jgi:hypothetical protein
LSRENIQPRRRRGKYARKETRTGTLARVLGRSGVVEDPTARLETSCTRTGRPRRHLWWQQPQDGGRRLRPHDPRARLRGVTLRRSTYEPFEQRQAVVGGEWGGKAAAQGEHFPIRHVPDSARDCACPTGGRVCGQATGLAAIHLREEPDALMSARPGPSGGCPVRGIPTGIASLLLRHLIRWD